MARRGRPPYDDQLTPAEWRVADALRHGGTNRSIGERLGISTDAVKFHLASMAGKLGLSGRRALRNWDGVPRSSALAQHVRAGEMTMTQQETPRWGSIGQIARSVTDIKAAEAWYRDVLRLPHLYTFGNLAFFDCGGTRLMLAAGENSQPDNYVIYFRVPDIQQAYGEFGARGIVFDAAPHMIHRHADGIEEWMAFFRDNEQRLLAIMCQVAPV